VDQINRPFLECCVLYLDNNGEADVGRPAREMKVSVENHGMWPPVCLVDRKHHIDRDPVRVGLNKGIMERNIDV